MRVQQSRTHVLPLTWEIPATIATSWLFLSLMVLPVGQGVASWLEGEGFSWPEGRVVETTLQLLRGRPDGDLAPAYGLIALLEVGVGAVAVLALGLWWRTYGPGTQHGLANRHEIAAALGRGNLRRRGRVIRPDLVGGGSRHGRGTA
jgi:hypothetical protein